jgi:hypothetical protein
MKDPFVERLTQVAVEQRRKEVILGIGFISHSRFRDLPEEFQKRLRKCVPDAQTSPLPADEPQAQDAPAEEPSSASPKNRLAEYLRIHPQVQAQLSSVTYYTPSKWLLEQEMASRVPPQSEAGSQSTCGDPERWSPEKGDVYDYTARQSLLGLCFSGGGIRSATFNLGILQSLAQLNLLKHVDYLSSVSGGGYIHQWLAAWIKRSSDQEHVRKQLVPQPETNCMPASAEPIRWLRRYASYLTPRRGIFSPDLWVVIAIWFRNTLLNQIVLFSVLGMVFAIPHLLVHRYDPVQRDRPQQAAVATVLAKPLALVPALSAWLQPPAHEHPHMTARSDASAGVPGSPEEHRQKITVKWWAGMALSVLVFLRVVFLFGANFSLLRKQSEGAWKELLTNAAVCMRIVVPLLLCSLWLTEWMADDRRFSARYTYAVLFLLFSIFYIVVTFCGNALGAYKTAHPHSKGPVPGILMTLAAVVSAASATALLPIVHKASNQWAPCLIRLIPQIAPSRAACFACLPQGVPMHGISTWRAAIVFMPPMYLAVLFFGLILLSGFLGSDYPEACREWLARFRAWTILAGGLWTLYVGMGLLGPYLASYLFQVHPLKTIGLFLAAHLGGLLPGASGKTDGKPSGKGFLGLKPLDFIAWVASPIALFAILLAVSAIVEKAGSELQSILPFAHPAALATVLILFASLVIQSTLGMRIDVNVFSMHAFYRNRLARCYLGGTNPRRRPDPFTGLDDNGELARTARKDPPAYKRRIFMSDLLPKGWTPPPGFKTVGDPDAGEGVQPPMGTYDGPFPIFCSTINLTFGQDLAWQERKGASFALTPLYSGYHVSWTAAQTQSHLRFNGYTESFKYTGGRGVALETAAATSGAAMNPNQGYNTLPAVASLMTLFNIRLGWWIWNPRDTRQDLRHWPSFRRLRFKITRPSPVCAMSSLIRELMGMVNDTSPFVLLTDGGHFENMGLYELVRRRCKLIVICDAEEDEKMQFSGIGRAIRNCRIDFGAEIDLDLRPLELQKDSSYSSTHCVVGTIRYPPPAAPDPGAKTAAVAADCSSGIAGDDCGIIVYIKASLVGDEPGDLLSYKNEDAAFPQDSTANQWFTESKFESYRRLGHHIGISVFDPAMASTSPRREEMRTIFDNLLQIWYPPTPEMQAHFTEHTQRYGLLMTELRTRPELRGFSTALFALDPEERTWFAPADVAGAYEYALQFGNSLIDFMWTVYNNLQLAFADNRTSPHAGRWISLFTRWCSVPLMRDAWARFRGVYGMEFQLFGESELGMPK